MNIKLNKKPLSVEVIVDDKVVKKQEINKQEFGDYIRELTIEESMLKSLRFIEKNFKPISYEYLNVKV